MKLINLTALAVLYASQAYSMEPDVSMASEIIGENCPKTAASPLDENHPAIQAATKISDLLVRKPVLEFCHVFQKNINIIVSWLVHDTHSPEDILVDWQNCSVQERPIFESGELYKHEIIKLEKLDEYLKTLWQGSPLVVADDYHIVTIKIQEEEQQVFVDFYDPYEPFGNGSFLEISIRNILDTIYHKKKGVVPIWYPHYTKHQRLTAFGECSLYASMYRNFLLKGREPHEVPEDEVLSNVAVLKEIMRDQNPDYFQRYDSQFQSIFDSGFPALLLEEVKRLPKTWGEEPEL